MPILGGNQSHDWSSSEDIDKLGLDQVHKHYNMDNDVAGQLFFSKEEKQKSKRFSEGMLANLKKWFSKEKHML